MFQKAHQNFKISCIKKKNLREISLNKKWSELEEDDSYFYATELSFPSINVHILLLRLNECNGKNLHNPTITYLVI